MHAIGFCIESNLIRNPAYGYNKILHSVRNVKYPNMDTIILYMETGLIRYPDLWIQTKLE